MFHQRYRAFWERALPWEDACLLLGITMGAARNSTQNSEKKPASGPASTTSWSSQVRTCPALIVGIGVSLLLMLQVPEAACAVDLRGPDRFLCGRGLGGDPPVVRAAAMALVGLLTIALGRDIPRYYPLSSWRPAGFLCESRKLS